MINITYITLIKYIFNYIIEYHNLFDFIALEHCCTFYLIFVCVCFLYLLANSINRDFAQALITFMYVVVQ